MDLNPFYYLYYLCNCNYLDQNQFYKIILSKKGLNKLFLLFSQTSFMAFQLGTEKVFGWNY